MTDPIIEKRKVAMTSTSTTVSSEGVVATATQTATDYIPLDILPAYVQDAATRWQVITVGDEHDPGPAGDDGPTVIPTHLEGDA